MRPRTPSIIWLPFVFSIGTISWAFLLASLAVLAAVLLAPPMDDLRKAEIQRNDLQATVKMLDDEIALRKDLIQSTNDPLVLQRFAIRQFNLQRRDQQPLILDPAELHRDRSVNRLLAESLRPVKPEPVPPLPWYLAGTLHPAMRFMLVLGACGGLLVAFMLGVRYDRGTA